MYMYTYVYVLAIPGPLLGRSSPHVQPATSRPAEPVEQPRLDPKYLPQPSAQDGVPSTTATTTAALDPLSSVTPGVLRPPTGGRGGGGLVGGRGGGRGGRGGRGGGGREGGGRGGKKGNAEPVPLLSAYFPNS